MQPGVTYRLKGMGVDKEVQSPYNLQKKSQDIILYVQLTNKELNPIFPILYFILLMRDGMRQRILLRQYL